MTHAKVKGKRKHEGLLQGGDLHERHRRSKLDTAVGRAAEPLVAHAEPKERSHRNLHSFHPVAGRRKRKAQHQAVVLLQRAGEQSQPRSSHFMPRGLFLEQGDKPLMRAAESTESAAS